MLRQRFGSLDMKTHTKYFRALTFIMFIFIFSACKDPYAIPENLVCTEDEPCIIDKDCQIILAPRSAFAGKTFEINGETYTVVCNLLIRDMINNGEDLSRVITTLVTDMSGLFEGQSEFNVDISNWDVSNVTTMASMFKGASSFNQDLSCWDVNNVEDMSGMFDGASAFNQDISNWNVEKVANCNDFANNALAWTLPKPSFNNCNP